MSTAISYTYVPIIFKFSFFLVKIILEVLMISFVNKINMLKSRESEIQTRTNSIAKKFNVLT